MKTNKDNKRIQISITRIYIAAFITILLLAILATYCAYKWGYWQGNLYGRAIANLICEQTHLQVGLLQ